MSEVKDAVIHRYSPYFGLEYYDEQYGAWFFGRETDGSKIITNLRGARLTLLHAESGVGKSSLLRAGVAWRMRGLADDMFARRRIVRSVPVVFSSWKDNPVGELVGQLGQAIEPYLDGQSVPELPGDQLEMAIRAATDAVNAGLLIMLDQFEEYFLYRSQEEPAPDLFADQLAACLNRTDLRANFLISIREDAYAGLGELFNGRIANIYGNYLHIDYLDRACAEQAIREPLAVYNSQPDVTEPVRLEDELVETVLDEVRTFDGEAGARPGGPTAANGGGSDRIATPLLQLVMKRIWDTERAEGSSELRLSTLQKLRGVKMIADAHLGEALDSLSSAERQTAINMFDHLVTPSGGKIAESVSDLAKRTGHSEDQVGSVLQKLDKEFIVRPIPAAPGQDPIRYRRYEIFHDVLAPTINRAIAAQEEKRQTRRIRRLAILAAGLLIIVSGVAVLFAVLLRNANDEKLTAESRQLAAEATLNVTRDPELSTLLALQALHLRDTSQAEDSLRAALPELQTVQTFEDGSTILSAAFDPVDNNQVASADIAGIASIWDVKTGKLLRSMSLGGFTVTGTADAVAFNPSGTELAVGYGGGVVALFDPRTGKKLESTTASSAVIVAVKFLGNTGELAIATRQSLVLWTSQNGSKCCDVLSSTRAYTVAVDQGNPHEFAVTTSDGAVIWNLADPGKPQKRQFGTGAENDAEFSPDGSQIVTADDNGNVDIYNVSTLKKVTTLNAGEANALTAGFGAAGQRIVAGYSSGTTTVWDVATKTPLTVLANGAGEVNAAQFSNSGNEVLTGSQDGTIRVWYAQPRELRTQFISLPDSTPDPMMVAGYLGNKIISQNDYGFINVYSATGVWQSFVTLHSILYGVAWDRAGTRIVTENLSGAVNVWRPDGLFFDEVPLSSPVQVSQANGKVAMSPDGSRFAVVTNYNFTIEVRSAQTGAVLQTLHARNPIETVAFSPDDRQVVAADYYGQVEVWNGTTTNPQLVGSRGPFLNNIEFNKSGSRIVTASAAGVVNVWNARDGKSLMTINACPAPSTAAFSPDSSMVVVPCGDGTVRVFDTASGDALTVLQATSVGTVTGAQFSPDGKSIVAAIDGGNTGSIQVWNAELANPSIKDLEHLAEQRVTERLTPAQQQQYLNGTGG